nr:copia protein [Tanacetum cinerariifolium]
GKIDQTLFIKRQKEDILLVQIYIDDIIFGATNKDLCKSFKKLMKDKFQMSSIGELTFFLGLQVKQKKDGIFISQDKYVAEILRKFRLTEVKSASTPIDTEKSLLKDPDGEDVDVHTYRLMIGSLVYLASSRPDIMFAVNDVTSLQALVNKKNVVVTDATIREALRLDDAEGVDCLPNEEIFAELARMGYEKPSTKLTFYKTFFSSQWKFFIHTILQCMSAKRTLWNEFSSSMASAVICLSTEQEIKEEGDADEHVEEVNAGDVVQGDVTTAHGEVPTVTKEPSIPSPTPPTPPPQPPQEVPSTSQRVKKLDKKNKGRMIAEIDQDDVVVLKDDKEEDKEVADKDVEEVKVDEIVQDKTEPDEVVDVVTTAKLITEVVTAASETVTTASAIIPTAEPQVPAATLTAAPARVAAAPSRRRKGVVIRDHEEESTTSTIVPVETKSKDKSKGILVEEHKPLKKKQQVEQDDQYARELHAELNKDIDWNEAIDNVKGKAKEDHDAKFNSNIDFLLKIKEKIEKDENKALQKINETPAKRAAKKRKLDEEVEDLKRHLQIVPNEDDDVYTEATPLARKVTIVDYKIIKLNNKPHYKIIRADETHQLYRTIHGPTKVKGWKLLESCGVQIITFTSTQLILLIEKRYPLTRFTLDQMLNAVRLKVEEESDVSLEFLRVSAAKQRLMLLDSVAETR